MKKWILILLFCSAAPASIFINSFNSGRLSKDLKVRADLERHTMGSETLTNILIRPQGMAYKRPGTEFIATCPNDLTFPGPQVAGDYTEYFVGITPYSGTKIVVNAKDDSTVDTTWGTSGYWDATPNSGPCYSMHQLADGRLLVAHNYYKVSMINTDGTTDTTWATNGTYTCPVGSAMTVYRILEDSDGNFHLFGGVAGSTANYVYVKIDDNGTYLGGLTRAQTKLRIINDAVWADDEKTRIIGVGQGVDTISVPPASSYLDYRYPNMVAINPSTIAVDTTWQGNLPTFPGYAQIPDGYSGEETLYHVFRTSDGAFIIYRNQTKRLAKVLSDGSGYDTTWGTDGEIDFSTTLAITQLLAQNPAQDGDEFYVLSAYKIGANVWDGFYHVDASGVLTLVFSEDNPSALYHMAQNFNDDQLLIGKTGGYLQIRNKTDFALVSQFQVLNANTIYWALPDETTREQIDSTVRVTFPAGSPVRLIPFEYATNDAYVIEMGHEYLGFLRTTP